MTGSRQTPIAVQDCAIDDHAIHDHRHPGLAGNDDNGASLRTCRRYRREGANGGDNQLTSKLVH